MRRVVALLTGTLAMLSLVPVVLLRAPARETCVLVRGATPQQMIDTERGIGVHFPVGERTRRDTMLSLYSRDRQAHAYMRPHDPWAASSDLYLDDVLVRANAGRPSQDGVISYSMSWAPDSRHAVFVEHAVDGYMLIFDRTAETVHFAEGDFRSTSWSPDGQWLYYTRVDDDTSTEMTLWQAGSGYTHSVFFHNITIHGARWAPNSAYLAYLSSSALANGQPSLDVFDMDTFTSTPYRLNGLPIVQRPLALPDWSPDSSKVALWYQHIDRRQHLDVFHTDGSPPTHVTSQRMSVGQFGDSWHDPVTLRYLGASVDGTLETLHLYDLLTTAHHTIADRVAEVRTIDREHYAISWRRTDADLEGLDVLSRDGLRRFSVISGAQRLMRIQPYGDLLIAQWLDGSSAMHLTWADVPTGEVFSSPADYAPYDGMEITLDSNGDAVVFYASQRDDGLFRLVYLNLMTQAVRVLLDDLPEAPTLTSALSLPGSLTGYQHDGQRISIYDDDAVRTHVLPLPNEDTVGWVRFSPNETFAAARYIQTTPTVGQSLYLLSTEGDITPLWAGPMAVDNMVWNSAGDRLLYVLRDASSARVAVANLDGTIMQEVRVGRYFAMNGSQLGWVRCTPEVL